MNITQIIHGFDVTLQSRVACLLSGGIDSMVLFSLLRELRKEVSFELFILHFNFHLRGEESKVIGSFFYYNLEAPDFSPRPRADLPLKGLN